MRNGVRVVSLLGWHGPSGPVSWIPGDDSRVGDAGTLLFDCNSCAVVKKVDFSYKTMPSAVPEYAV